MVLPAYGSLGEGKDNALVAAPWTARYADLTGKTAIVAGDDGPTLVEVVRALAANAMLLAVVTSDRAIVDTAVAVADGLGTQVFGMAADPASETAWARIVPHIEQRVGPIDVIVAIGTAGDRSALADAVIVDMVRRHRGVVIEVGPGPSRPLAPEGIRNRHILGGDPSSVAAAALLCASDAMPSPTLQITLTNGPSVGS
jgi:hypothetical protein